MSKLEWIFNQHKNTNHLYDVYLPYEFHLRMAHDVFDEFKDLLDDTVDYYTGKREIERGCDNTVTLHHACYLAVYGHDLIEDTRVSYNDVKGVLGQEAADIIYAVTNEKGKTRKERANAKYYQGIRETPGAVFVKLCDRIANVRYGTMTKSRMVEMYAKEQKEFEKALGRYTDYKHLEPMFKELDKLFS